MEGGGGREREREREKERERGGWDETALYKYHRGLTYFISHFLQLLFRTADENNIQPSSSQLEGI